MNHQIWCSKLFIDCHAFLFCSFRYGHKLGNLKVYTLTQTLQARKGENLFLQAKFVLSTLEAFFASADTFIKTEHVPDTRLDEKTGLKVPIDCAAKQVPFTRIMPAQKCREKFYFC